MILYFVSVEKLSAPEVHLSGLKGIKKCTGHDIIFCFCRKAESKLYKRLGHQFYASHGSNDTTHRLQWSPTHLLSVKPDAYGISFEYRVLIMVWTMQTELFYCSYIFFHFAVNEAVSTDLQSKIRQRIIRHHNIPSTVPSREQATNANCLNLHTLSIKKRFIFSEKNTN